MTRALPRDVICGGIAAHLRMCGFDTVSALDRDIEADTELLHVPRTRAGRSSLAIDSSPNKPSTRSRSKRPAAVWIRCQPGCSGSLRQVTYDRSPDGDPGPGTDE
jgi:hypothetical protein